MERKILKFYADWCGPCKAMTPVVQKVASKHDIVVEHINIDDEQDVALLYKIQSIPTVVLLEDGIEIARQVGSSIAPKLELSLGLIS